MRRLLFGLFLIVTTHPAAAQGFWYCDPAHAYYPYVQTCSAPWREIAPYSPGQAQPQSVAPPAATSTIPAWVAPIPPAASPPDTQASAAYRQGQRDRQAWETWFNALTSEYREGAAYWADQRSSRPPVSCDTATRSTGSDWTAGCHAAKQKLTPSDARRAAEPEYRLGWNNPPEVSAPPTAPEAAGAPTPLFTTSTPGASSRADMPTTQLAAPTPAGAPYVRQSLNGNQDDIAHESSEDWHIVTVTISIIVGAFGLLALKNYITRKRRYRALRISAAEIASQAAILRVKRIQTVIPDAYGTIIWDKWQKEKDYFASTRILPTLRSEGLDVFYQELGAEIDLMIETAARRSIPPASGLTSRFISNPEIFDPRMDPIDYERHCALELGRAGWNALVTVATGDQGADVIARRAGKVLVLQCKLYGSPVGNDAVQQVIAARQFQSADLAAVASNQPFTRSAQQLAHVSGVFLLHHEQLAAFVG